MESLFSSYICYDGNLSKKRELGSLNKIKDNYPKIAISADRLKADFEGGIRHINIIDWLLDANKKIIKYY